LVLLYPSKQSKWVPVGEYDLGDDSDDASDDREADCEDCDADAILLKFISAIHLPPVHPSFLKCRLSNSNIERNSLHPPLRSARIFPMSSLYTKGRILGHKRGKRNSRPNQSLVAIEGVDTKEAARSYLGKVRDFGTKGRTTAAGWDGGESEGDIDGG
jgi:hypothetical protein